MLSGSTHLNPNLYHMHGTGMEMGMGRQLHMYGMGLGRQLHESGIYLANTRSSALSLLGAGCQHTHWKTEEEHALVKEEEGWYASSAMQKQSIVRNQSCPHF